MIALVGFGGAIVAEQAAEWVAIGHEVDIVAQHRHSGSRRRSRAVSKYRGSNHEGPDHAAPYPLSRLAPQHDLVSMAEEIAAADSMLTAVVSAELETIARQIRSLREQAGEVLGRAQRDAE